MHREERGAHASGTARTKKSVYLAESATGESHHARALAHFPTFATFFTPSSCAGPAQKHQPSQQVERLPAAPVRGRAQTQRLSSAWALSELVQAPPSVRS